LMTLADDALQVRLIVSISTVSSFSLGVPGFTSVAKLLTSGASSCNSYMIRDGATACASQ